MKTLLTTSSFLLLIVLAVRCTSAKDYDFEHHPYDLQVIQRIPLYDSLSQVLMRNFKLIEPEVREYVSFDYTRKAKDDLKKSIPPEAFEKVNQYFDVLGEKFIIGFSVFKDSSVRYFLRETYLEKYGLVVNEQLVYLPNGGKMRHSAFPNKDTVLNKNWQYRVDFYQK